MASGSWITDGNGNWTDSLNWNGGTIADGAGFTADFTNNITNNTSVSLNGTSRTIGTINFSDGGAADKTWTITRTGAETLTVTTVSTVTNATIAVPIATGTFTKATGTAKLTLTGGSSSTSAWNVNAGTLEITTNAITGTSGIVTVASEATLTSNVNFAKPITANAGSSVRIDGGATYSSSGLVKVYTRDFTFDGSGTTTISNSTALDLGSAAPGLLKLKGTHVLVSTVPSPVYVLAGASGALWHTGGVFGRTTAGNLFFQNNVPSTVYASYRGESGASLGGTGAIGKSLYYLMNGVMDFRGVTLSSTYFNGVAAGQLGINNTLSQIIHRSGTSTAGTAGSVTFSLGYSTETGATYDLVVCAGSSLTASGSTQFNGSTSGRSLVVINGAGSTYSTSEVTTFGTPAVSGIHIKDGGKFAITGSYLATGGLAASSIILFGNGNKLGSGTGAPAVISAPITPATGSGVSSVTVGASLGADYIGPPMVKVTGGGGTGAVVTAIWDSDTRTITGYEIQSPGTGYTSAPTITLSGGGFSSAATAPTASISANATDSTVTKEDTGTLALSGTNTYTGTTTVSNGTLSIGNGGAGGTLGLNDTGAAVIASGKTLNFNRSDSRTYTGVISGQGNITKTTAGGTAILDAANTFTGTVQATTGALRAVRSDSFGAGASSLTAASGGAIELAGNITVARNLNLTGTGDTTTGALRNISGSNTISGSLSIGGAFSIGSDAGTLALSNIGDVTLSATNTATFVGNGDIDLSPRFIGANGTVTKASGTGCAILRGANTYTGVTTITTGRLGFVGNIAASTNGSFGNASSAASLLISANAGIRYYGSGNNTWTGRGYTFPGTSGTHYFEADSSATGTIDIQVAPTYSTTESIHGLGLGGGSTQLNRISFPIVNNGFSVNGFCSVVKVGAGKWMLTNFSNEYAGGTDVGPNGGTLVLSVGSTADSWAAGRSVTNAANGQRVQVHANSTIQTLSGTPGNATRQLGRHTYNNLIFRANSRIRIGG